MITGTVFTAKEYDQESNYTYFGATTFYDLSRFSTGYLIQKGINLGNQYIINKE